MKRKFNFLNIRSTFLFLILFNVFHLNSIGQNWLSCQGNKLFDSRGNEVRLTGINWFGFETAQFKFHGIWSRDMKSVLKQIKDMGFNCIRIPWTDAMLKPGATVQIDSYGTDPYTGVSPMNGDIVSIKTPILLLDEVVKWCQANNMKIILDNHARIADGFLGESLWYSPEVPEATWINNWVFMATRYRDYDALIGMDLDNEPHGKQPGSPSTSTWGNSNPATDWNKAAERAGNAILRANPNVLILVEGIELHNGEHYWWGGNLLGVRTHPVVLSNPAKLVYSPHEYGPTVHPQPWFTDPAFPSNMPAMWDKFFGYIHNLGTAPLLVGEFGIKTQGGTDEVWIRNFLTYMGNKYSWTFWCFNPNSGDTGGIVGDDWTTPVRWKLDLLRPYLAPMIPNGSGVIVNRAPVANAGADKSVTLPASNTTLTGSGIDSDGIISGYSWTQVSGPGTATLTGATTSTLTASGLIAGSYIFRLTVTDNGGLRGFDDALVVVSSTVNTPPIASFIAAPVSGSAPLAVSFDASASSDANGDALTYTWNFGDGTAGTGRALNHIYAAGSYTATLTVSDGRGGSHTFARVITSNGIIPTGSLKVQYKVGDASATDNAIKPQLRIVNTGSEAVVYSDIKIRYWYTREGTAAQTFFVDWAQLGSANITGTFVAKPSPVPSANYYLEVGFSAAAGSLPPGGSSGEIQARFSKNDWTNYTETGDYSYDPTKNAFADWNRITLYINGVLIWGTEPTSTAARVATESEVTEIEFLTYPNPTSDRVTIKLPEEWQKEGQITLANEYGRVFISQKIKYTEHTIDISKLRPGLYFITVSNKSNQVIHKLLKN